MIKLLFSPPIIYYLIIVIILLSLLAYRRRKFIKKELRRWRAKEISAGPIKFERDAGQAPKKRGVQIGLKGDFSGAQIKNIAGRDILQGDELVSNKLGARLKRARQPDGWMLCGCRGGGIYGGAGDVERFSGQRRSHTAPMD